MHILDQDHTSFITDVRLYCYKVMSFGLKNSRATNQRMVNKMFVTQMGCMMEFRIIDMLLNLKKSEDHTNAIPKYV